MENLTGIIAVLGALSLSVERVVEMIKNVIPFLSKNQDVKEGWRRSALQLMSVVAGTGIAFAAKEQIQPLLSNIFNTQYDMKWHTFIVFGLLASGGSGLWNQTLSIVEEVKKAKKNTAAALKSGAN
jgi:hypothetical protein